jgi:hypothetical protein
VIRFNKPKNKGNFLILLIYLFCFGSAIPLSYTIIFPYLNSYYFTLDLVSNETLLKGGLYTLLASILMLRAAYLYWPQTGSVIDENRYKSLYLRYRTIFFYLAILSLCLGIILDIIYGKVPSNVTAQRPPIALYLGYFSRGVSQSANLVILISLFHYKRIDRYSVIIILLILIQSITSQSRSAIFDIIYIILLGLAYSAATANKISFNKIIIIIIGGLIAIILGDMSRGSLPFEVFVKAIPRFYQNNQALYLAIEDPVRIYNILTDGQPRVLLQSLFSFVIERTEYPSSFRLLEYWGGSISTDEYGHIAGYSFGWLGLTYGLFGWLGLIAIYLFYLWIFAMLRFTAVRPTLTSIVLFAYIATLLFESFGNLGMDSFLEKAFKGFLYANIYIVFVRILESVIKAQVKFRLLR